MELTMIFASHFSEKVNYDIWDFYFFLIWDDNLLLFRCFTSECIASVG